MKLTAAGLLVCVLFILAAVTPARATERSVADTVDPFIRAAARNDRAALAALVSYPLRRDTPLSRIDTPQQFLEAYDEILDDAIVNAVASSNGSADWSEVGWRGIMFQNGLVWLDGDGRLTAVNYETQQGKRKRAQLIAADQQRLHPSVRDFTAPVLEWETATYRIRIDRIAGDRFRYAVWPVRRSTADKPDLILGNGSVTYEGSGGNHHYDFTSDSVRYRCTVWVMGEAGSPPGDLEVYRRGKLVLTQPVVRVIHDR